MVFELNLQKTLCLLHYLRIFLVHLAKQIILIYNENVFKCVLRRNVTMSLTRDNLIQYVHKYIETVDNCDTLENDCNIIEYMLDNCEIKVPEENRFFVGVNCEGIMADVVLKRGKKFDIELEKHNLKDGCDSLAFTGIYDIGHTSAEWERVISLGIFGLREELKNYLEKSFGDYKKERFFNNTIRVYDAALRFIERCANVAVKYNKKEMADGLFSLCTKSPSNLFEALQTSIIYYTLQHIFDGTYLRTLGRLDKLLYPFYVVEKNNAPSLIMDYIKEIDRLKAPSNIPFAIGGTDINGKSSVNDLSYLILDTYKKANTNNTKFHLMCSANTPTDIIESAFGAIRDGNNSIVFMSDERIIESLKLLGEAHEDACNYHIVGCYECGGNNEITCSCNARVNIPKALELALNHGRDMLNNKLIGLETESNFETYEDLYLEFEHQLEHLCKCAMKCTDLYEKHYNLIHSAPIFSATYTSALENGGDLYCDNSAKYCNSSVNALGLATATDSLLAIKKMVYDDKILTLNELITILKANWRGNEPLRITIKNRYPKFGNADKTADEIAKRITDKLADVINGKPNVKGGKYRLGLFSIDWRWEFGEKTAASANGRMAGETLSQNTSATFGCDKQGATSHLLSVSNIDTSKTPNGTIVDIDLHSSSVKGKNGLNSLVASLKTYFQLGGFAVHYNVLDTDILRDAKMNPEKYPNLQVRLCGWNVLFATLSDKEKDEFIERSIR